MSEGNGRYQYRTERNGNSNGREYRGDGYQREDRPTLLNRRQKWGIGCKSMMAGVLEYNTSTMKPVAIIDYLHEDAPQKRSGDERYKVLKVLCDQAAIPLIACRYGSDFSWFHPHALNDFAAGIIVKGGKMEEFEWVRLLYRIRHEEVPHQVESGLRSQEPKFAVNDSDRPEEVF